MRLKHIAIIGSLFPILISIVLFFGVLISAEDDDGGGNYSSSFGGMNLSAEVLKHQPMVEKYAKEYGISEYVNVLLAIIQVESGGTAIDMHTVHETETIQLRLNDTSGIENFVKNFAKSYYTWNNSKEAIEARTQAISGYLTKELQDLNVDTIRTDIPTSSTVTEVLVWSIEQSGTDTFSATYEVDQQIKEGEQTTSVKATYTVKVHVDADGNMVIVQNPTLAPAIEKSDYEPKTPEADNSVDADTINDATAFLETFFKLYPTSTEKELAYYVSGNALEPIGRDYLYSELVNPIFTKDGDNVKVKVSVKFLDNQTKATQISQYELTLHKDGNWKII